MESVISRNSIVTDVAALMWRCATCDGLPIRAIKPATKHFTSKVTVDTSKIEPKKVRGYRQKLCRFVVGEFLDSCGITRQNLLSKSKSWLPYIAIGLAVVALVAAL